MSFFRSQFTVQIFYMLYAVFFCGEKIIMESVGFQLPEDCHHWLKTNTKLFGSGFQLVHTVPELIGPLSVFLFRQAEGLQIVQKVEAAVRAILEIPLKLRHIFTEIQRVIGTGRADHFGKSLEIWIAELIVFISFLCRFISGEHFVVRASGAFFTVFPFREVRRIDFQPANPDKGSFDFICRIHHRLCISLKRVCIGILADISQMLYLLGKIIKGFIVCSSN